MGCWNILVFWVLVYTIFGGRGVGQGSSNYQLPRVYQLQSWSFKRNQLLLVERIFYQVFTLLQRSNYLVCAVIWSHLRALPFLLHPGREVPGEYSANFYTGEALPRGPTPYLSVCMRYRFLYLFLKEGEPFTYCCNQPVQVRHYREYPLFIGLDCRQFSFRNVKRPVTSAQR